MNTKQRVVIGVGIIAIAVTGLFPPWTFKWKGSSPMIEIPAGYHFFFSPPDRDKERIEAIAGSRLTSYELKRYTQVNLDTSRLIIEWLFVVLVVSGLVLVLSDRKGAPCENS